jgi:hypothetical protein
VSQLEEWTFDDEKQSCCGGVNADLHSDESGHRRERDVVARAELLDEMDDESYRETPFDEDDEIVLRAWAESNTESK